MKTLLKAIQFGRNRALKKPAYYGPPISLEEAVCVTRQVLNYYQAMKSGDPLPPKPHRSLAYLLRCNGLVQIHSLGPVKSAAIEIPPTWYMPEEHIIAAWLRAYRYCPSRPVFQGKTFSIEFKKHS